jgi:photosystem II stability/assembly factor-like uncharacterized protein
MKNFYIFVFCIFTNILLNAQNDDPYWEYLCSPTGGGIENFIIDKEDNIYIRTRNGNFLSTNNGRNWQSLGYNERVEYNSFIKVLGFTNDNTMYHINDIDNKSSLELSKDIGKTWETVYEFGELGIVFGLVIDKNDRIYIVSGWITVSITVRYSDDYGKTWDSCNTDYITRNYGNDLSIMHIQIVQDTILTIGGFWDGDDDRGGMICKYNESKDSFEIINTPYGLINWNYLSEKEFLVGTQYDLQYTTDGGETWEIIFEKSTYNILSISDNEYYICNAYDGVHHTTDKGKTWTALNNGLEEAAITQVSITKDSILIATGYNGFYYSSDKGNTWIESNEGFTSNNVTGMSFDKHGNLYAVDYYHFLKSTDNGETWSKHYFYPDRFDCILVTKDNTIIVGGHNSTMSNMQISRDGGVTWKETEEYTKDKSCIIQISSGRIFAGGYSLHYSDDDGQTWQRPSGSGSSWSIAENNEGHVFVAGDCGTIYRSIDNGTTFVEVQKSQILDHPGSSDIMFCKDEPIGIKLGRYYRSSNNGKTWYEPETYVRGIHLAMDSLGCMYAVGAELTQSIDGFLTLVPMNTEGLYHDRFNDIEISPNGHIYLAAEYGGIYRSRDKFVSVEKEISDNSTLTLSPPIPNPTSGETKISFDLPEASEINIKVSDVLGNIIINRSNKYYSQGRHTEIINFDSCPSGIYFISLYGNGEVITEKVEVVK